MKILLSVLFMMLCACNTDKLRSTTGFTVVTPNTFERIPNSAIARNQFEAMTFVDIQAKNMVVLTTIEKSDIISALLDAMVAASENSEFETSPIVDSEWVKGGKEFDSTSDIVMVKMIAVEGTKYLYLIECYADASAGFSPGLMSVVKSFNVE